MKQIKQVLQVGFNNMNVFVKELEVFYTYRWVVR